MKTMRRRICWLAVCVFVAAIAAVPLLALVNGRWASEAALGDVVISYDSVVRFYDNATGVEKDSNPSTPLIIDGISVPGNNFGIAFDGALNLFVTNQNGTTSSVKRVSEGETHPLHSAFATQADPRKIVFAGNGDYFVASRTTVATEALIRRYNSSGTQVGKQLYGHGRQQWHLYRHRSRRKSDYALYRRRGDRLASNAAGATVERRIGLAEHGALGDAVAWNRRGRVRDSRASAGTGKQSNARRPHGRGLSGGR